MGILSRLFGSQDPEKQKLAKFREFELHSEKDDDAQELVTFNKAMWLSSRGSYYGQHGNFEQAVIDLKESIELKPNLSAAYYALGILYRDQKMFDEAFDILHEAPYKTVFLKKVVGDCEFNICNALATVYLLVGDKLKGLEYVKKALVAIDNPTRIATLAEAKDAGVICDDEYTDVQMKKMLKDLIHELEEDLSIS